MREIKFRAWIKSGFDEDVKPFMTDVASIDFSEFGHSLKTPEDDNEWDIKENCILMQYTGLKDKNGKEIYEGDIVTWEEDNLADMGEKIIHAEGKSQIVWVKEFCHFGIEEIPKKLGHWTFSEDARYEVIGNIYEHGHLLNGK